MQASPEGDTCTLRAARAVTIREETLDQAMKTIRNRIDQIGVTEPVIQRYGDATSYQMLVQLPGVGDTDRVKDVIQSTALLELKIVDAGPSPNEAAARASYGGLRPGNLQLLPMNKTGADSRNLVRHGDLRPDNRPGSERCVYRARFEWPPSSRLQPHGRGFAAVCSTYGTKCRKTVGDRARWKSPVRARDSYADRGLGNHRGRPFGIPVDAGACAWRGLYSRYRSAVTLGAVSVFMAAYYQMAGVNAIIAMILNIVILLAAIAYFAITLTLPGIAGVTLTIGVRYRLQYPHL